MLVAGTVAPFDGLASLGLGALPETLVRPSDRLRDTFTMVGVHPVLHHGHERRDIPLLVQDSGQIEVPLFEMFAILFPVETHERFRGESTWHKSRKAHPFAPIPPDVHVRRSLDDKLQ